jgi:hypothetical protein
MYSDYLFIDKSSFKNGIINKYTREIKSQPGLIFYDVIKAFDKCNPLIDHDQDVLRLYNDICEILNFPSFENMIQSLIGLIEARFENSSFKESIAAPYFKVALILLKEKQKDPLLFLNNLIYSDKFGRFNELLEGKTAISTIKSISDREDSSFTMFESIEYYTYQLLNNYPIRCPIEYILSLFPNSRIYPRECTVKNQTLKECTNCYFKKILNLNYINKNKLL